MDQEIFSLLFHDLSAISKPIAIDLYHDPSTATVELAWATGETQEVRSTDIVAVTVGHTAEWIEAIATSATSHVAKSRCGPLHERAHTRACGWARRHT